MASLREQLESLAAPPEALDPEDADAFGDATNAGAAKKSRRRLDVDTPDLAPAKGRLRLRAPVPELEGYAGRRVSRRDAFGEAEADPATSRAKKKRKHQAEEEKDEVFPVVPSEEDDEEPAGAIGGVSAGGFSISAELEKEYERMMGRAKQDLEVMRRPAEAEVEQRRQEAQSLKTQLEAWKALVELRIHFEGCLSIGHRLPVVGAAGSSAAARALQGPAGIAADAEVRGLLGTLLALQEGLASKAGVNVGAGEGALSAVPEGEEGGRSEAAAWGLVDARAQSVLDWGVGLADEWKEKTRLDARRSFKVLDQSLRTQMQAAAEVEPAKLRRRSTPPPGRHRVFGAAPAQAPAADGEAAAAGGGVEGAPGEEQDIFDDRDFYVSLLREVLADGAGAKDALAGETAGAREIRQEVQGRRASKKKSGVGVERRASKGRKIRYVPIEKLQNFMAPQPRPESADGDAGLLAGSAAVDALLRSLFA